VTESLLLLLNISCKGGRELGLFPFPFPVSVSIGEEALRDDLGGREEVGAGWGDKGVGEPTGAPGGDGDGFVDVGMPWYCCVCEE